MKPIDLIDRDPAPAPWSEAENIPWNDPAFSERMLREHLSQRNDRASRRQVRIARQVRWLHEEILHGEPSLVLDLACGPGLYTVRLAELGHRCLGIDYAPAAIEHARREAEPYGERCRYLEEDIRIAPYGEALDLCMFIHGEFNSYRRSDAEGIVGRAYRALAPGGRLIVEVHTEETIEQIGASPPIWYTARAGLFSDSPHLVLKENFWDADERAATERYYVLDLAGEGVEQVTSTSRAYTGDEYDAIFRAAGFRQVDRVEGLGDPEGAAADGLFALVATR